jgi:threonine/homoserine/homoserine lactone efflux protein
MFEVLLAIGFFGAIYLIWIVLMKLYAKYEMYILSESKKED